MPKLSDLLTSAAAVRNESAAEQNTALRVGNVLYFLTQYLQQYTSVADISMKVSSVGVTITAKSQTGDNTLFDKTIALPVASSEQAGILTAEAFSAFLSDISELQGDLTALSNEKDVLAERIKVNAENIADLGLALRGKSANSSAYYDPFISMGDIKGWPEFSGKLDAISEQENKQKYMGRCRARVDGVTVEVYHFINSFSKNDYTQVLLGNVSAVGTAVTFTPNKFNIIYRQYKEGKWLAWQRINDNPLATSSLDGLMSAADKEKLDVYPSQFVLDLGLVETQEAGEQEAAKSEVAGNRNISFIRFQVQGVRTLKTSLIMQWPNGIDETAQIKCVDKAQWRRNVTGATGVEGAPTTATPWERTAPHLIDYDKSRRMLQLKDHLGKGVPNEVGVELPLATSTQDGLMSAEDKTKLNQTKSVEEVTWTEQHAMNAYTECGEYHIHGERKNKYDGLPIINADPGHTIDATLTVLDSSLTNGTGAKTDTCVTQILRMSNRTGGDGHIFIRTGQASTKSQLASGSSTYWGTWEKLMGMFEKNDIDTIEDLDGYTTNGMYSGIYAGTSPKNFYTVRFLPGDTLLMITINGYAVSNFGMTPQITQFLYKLPAKMSTSEQNAEMYIRTGHWNATDKKWVWRCFIRMATAEEFNALETRIAALEAKLK